MSYKRVAYDKKVRKEKRVAESYGERGTHSADHKISRAHHAMVKATKRYGIHVTLWDLCDIVQSITTQTYFKGYIKHRLLYNQSNNKVWYSVYIKEKWCIIVFDKWDNSVATFLPNNGYIDEKGRLLIDVEQLGKNKWENISHEYTDVQFNGLDYEGMKLV